MTPQQIFSTVVDNLRKQGSKSLLTDEQIKKLRLLSGACAYRGMDGKCCAIGGLLTDEEYQLKMEGANLSVVVGMAPSFACRINYDDNYQLLRRLQMVHDQYSVKKWEAQFQQLAEDYHLIYTSR